MRLFITIQLKNDSDLTRVSRDAPAIIQIINAAAAEPAELVFRSNDGLLFGWFLITDKNLRVIRSNIERSTAFRNGDAMLMFEVGPDFSGLGFTRQWTWLQHHPAK